MGVPELRAAACAALALACEPAAPAPMLEAIAPARAYTDRPLRVTLRGAGFLPSFQVNAESGGRAGDTARFSGRVGDGPGQVELRDFGWRGTGELTAWMQEGLPVGLHAVEVVDPRGERASLPDGFEALGTDLEPPTLNIAEPGPSRPIAPGMVMPVRLEATEVAPARVRELRWRARAAGRTLAEGACPVEPEPTRVICAFGLPLPAALVEGEDLELTATAVDDAPAMNRTDRARTLPLLARPRVTALSPTRGGVAGGTDIVIRGVGFLPGTRALLDGEPLWPGGGVLVDATTLSGRAPAHAAGPATLEVRTPVGNTTPLPNAFSYEPPPVIEAIFPSEGEPDGGTPVILRGKRFSRETRVFFGATLVAAQPLEDLVVVGPEEIKGTTPPGRGRTSLWAFDRDLGWTRLAGAWTWSAP